MRWTILVVLFLARTAMGFQFQSIASMTPYLIEDLRITYGEVGSLIGIYLLPGVFVALPSAVLQNRFGDQSTCSLGLFLMAAGGAMIGVSDGYAVASFGRLVSGVGAVLLNLVVTKMVTDWFADREISFAMGVIAASWGVGISLGLLVQDPLAALMGWKGLMYLVALLCTLALVLVLLVYRPPPFLHQQPQQTLARPSIFNMPKLATLACLSAGVTWGIFNAGLVIFFSFTPDFLGNRGFTLIEGASITSLTLWVSIFFIPVSGYLVHRIGKPDFAIVIFSLLTGGSLLLLVAAPSMAVLLCILAGVVIGPPVGVILALPARVVTPEQRATGVALFYTCYYVLATLGPPIAGILRDISQNAASPVLLSAALFLMVPATMVPFWMLTRRSK